MVNIGDAKSKAVSLKKYVPIDWGMISTNCGL